MGDASLIDPWAAAPDLSVPPAGETAQGIDPWAAAPDLSRPAKEAPRESPTIGTGEDIARSVAGQGTLGLADIAALPGTLGQAYNWAKGKITGAPVDETPPADSAWVDAQRKGYMTRVGGVPLPTGAGVEHVVNQLAPWTTYQPQTEAGSLAGGAARMASGAVVGGPLLEGAGLLAKGAPIAEAAGAIAKSAAPTAVRGAVAGAASEGAGDAAKNLNAPWWVQSGARIAGAVGSDFLTHKISDAAEGLFMPSVKARDELTSALAQDLRNGKSAMTPEQIADAHENGLSPSVYDMAGPATKGVLNHYSQLTPEAQQANGDLARTLAERRAAAGVATGAHISSLYGSLDAPAIQAAIGAEAKSNNDTLYRIARSDPAAQSLWTQNLHAISGAPPVQKAMQDAHSVSLYPASGVRSFAYDASGNLTGAPNLSYWDQVKRSLDDQISTARRTGANDEAARVSSLKNSLVGELDQNVPAYATARSTAAEGFGASNSIEAGYNALKNMNAFKGADVSQAFNRMTPPQQSLFGTGAASYLKEASERGGPGAITRMFKDPQVESRARMALGDDNFESILGHATSNDLLTKASPLNTPLGAPAASHWPVLAGALASAGADVASGMLLRGEFSPSLRTLGVGATGAGVAAAHNIATEVGNRRVSPRIMELAGRTDPQGVAELGKELSRSPATRSLVERAGRYALQRSTSATAQPTAPTKAPYARGGKVGHQHLVDRLFRHVERAKREEKTHTSSLLNQPDTAVAKALNAAQRAI